LITPDEIVTEDVKKKKRGWAEDSSGGSVSTDDNGTYISCDRWVDDRRFGAL
jgi:hypothetical protein